MKRQHPVSRISRHILGRLALNIQAAATEQGLTLDQEAPLNGLFLQRQAAPPNRLLLYPGSFNPPHRGHKALLQHALAVDTSLLGAIIVLTDDERLATKNRRDQRPFLLSKSKRVSLWRGASSDLGPNRVWVFDGSEDSWKALRASLQTRLAREGFRLEFVLLTGPDLVTSRRVADPSAWGCVEAITSDVSRPADFRCVHSLRQLPRCTPWEPSSSTETTDIRDPLGYPMTSATALWKCQTSTRPIRRYRFAVADTDAASAQREAPSSTEIRRVIAELDGSHLESELERLALSPTLLMRYASEGGPYTVPVVRAEKYQDHQTRKAMADEQATW
ncbi:hypothetical protein L249_1217 [Ophiocordyceps polyrhachis-furcata BCC 54312]|uniref:Cytidyltransferase-like domain-containing protein n=1 Tax=Ophiocordyceps polyrhachis-furcata BCC 54312 TaxID=1330021 RepID=A0A367LDT4_9HYPO|nr:hypothetical protein L249_1217 [Ophiocordyceps polyrhachis-furcata BCC 54312]